MEDTGTLHITSFVIRFVQEGAVPAQAEKSLPSGSYRGTILHVQTDDQISFTRWEDAVDFIRRFVSLEPQEMPSGSHPSESQ